MSPDVLPAGSIALLDANVLVYHFAGASAQCSRVLSRAERGDLRLCLSATSYAEALHRLMIAEARSRGLLTGSNPARQLKERPELVRQLREYLKLDNLVTGAGIAIVPLTSTELSSSHGFRSRYGLLVNDSLLVATAVAQGVRAVVTADADLASVAELDVFSPDDLGTAG